VQTLLVARTFAMIPAPIIRRDRRAGDWKSADAERAIVVLATIAIESHRRVYRRA